MRWGVVVSCILISACTVQADHDLDIYAFDDIFVFDVLERGSRLIRFVSLTDSADLKIASELKTSQSFPLSSYGHHQKFLIVSFHNRIEIYNVNNVASPELTQTLSLQEDHLPRFRWPKIANLGSRYFIVSRRAVAELKIPSQNASWHIDRLTTAPLISKEHQMNISFPPFNHSQRFAWPFVVKETSDFRYEVGWKTTEWVKGKRGGSYQKHRKYLSKVRTSDKVVVSSLLLGELMKTGE